MSKRDIYGRVIHPHRGFRDHHHNRDIHRRTREEMFGPVLSLVAQAFRNVEQVDYHDHRLHPIGPVNHRDALLNPDVPDEKLGPSFSRRHGSWTFDLRHDPHALEARRLYFEQRTATAEVLAATHNEVVSLDVEWLTLRGALDRARYALEHEAPVDTVDGYQRLVDNLENELARVRHRRGVLDGRRANARAALSSALAYLLHCVDEAALHRMHFYIRGPPQFLKHM